ncbi:transcriptional enhancer factor TEF-5 [Esox lucius]|uniref:transcriptional enhancer factor TEF-5 n=1 Tax=Esox lucius TaxID=8010 RepID=UPI0014774819|nr:transcriptional enhancer factor TEF-5 [Esox lucius]
MDKDSQEEEWSPDWQLESSGVWVIVRGAIVIIASDWSCRVSPEGGQEDVEEEGLGGGTERGLDGDPEGVWSSDIEQSFHEALAIYPPCGRRKIILSDEGRMYGRNELIARYIKLRTGKTRTRKQVSSHIQVLARKRVREYQTGIKAMNMDQVSKDKALQNVANLSSAQIVSASMMKSQPPYPQPIKSWPGSLAGQHESSRDIKLFAQSAYLVPLSTGYDPSPTTQEKEMVTPVASTLCPDRTISSDKLCLLEYSAFMETHSDPETVSIHQFVHLGLRVGSSTGLGGGLGAAIEPVDVRQIYDKFPEKTGGLKDLYDRGPRNAFYLIKVWADLSCSVEEGSIGFYGVTSHYIGTENVTLSVSTKVCSFGKQVVEKVETEYAHMEGGKCVYHIQRSPMCEYMINFIHKLKHLPEKYMMNSVLENFTILQVVSNRETQETLLCIAFVFEVSTSEHGAQYHVYRLVKD